MQIAPFDDAYAWNNDSTGYINHMGDRVTLNDWKGSITQESASAVVKLDNISCERDFFAILRILQTNSIQDGGVAYQTFGFE